MMILEFDTLDENFNIESLSNGLVKMIESFSNEVIIALPTWMSLKRHCGLDRLVAYRDFINELIQRKEGALDE